MASDGSTPRSRRALLTAAAGAAGALAASAALPLAAAAAPANMQTESDNATIAATSVTQGAGGSIAFKARTANTDYAGLVASTGDETFIASDTSYTGAYGWAPTGGDTSVGVGVLGDSEDWGVFGRGGVGVYGYGAFGVIGESYDTTTPGVLAYGASASSPALEVQGKVKFNRSGRNTIGSGKSSLKVTLAGVSSSSRVSAVLHSNRSGRYVRAVVPTSGSFTVYLNTSVTSATYVAWFVLD